MEHFRGSRWFAVGLVSLMLGLSTWDLLRFDRARAGLFISLLIFLWSFVMVLIWLIRLLIGRGRRLAALSVLGVYVLGMTMWVYSGRVLVPIRQGVIWPYREPSFELLRADFVAHERLKTFCSWGQDEYRVNNAFFGEYLYHGEFRVGMYAYTQGSYYPLDREKALQEAGLTEEGLETLAEGMERVGVSCAKRLTQSGVILVTWGFLDNECGYVFQDPSLPPPNMHGTVATRLSFGGWYEYCY